MTQQPDTGSRSGGLTPGTPGASPPSTTGSGGGTTERAKEAAGQATEQAKHVAAEAKEQTREVVGDVRDRARDLVGKTQGELKDQAEARTQHAAEGLRTWSQQLHALREGRPDQAGPVAGYVAQAERKVSDVADRLQRDGFQGVVSEATTFARRRPGAFLVACAAAGFAVARLARSQSGGDTDGDGSQLNRSTATSVRVNQ
jgi:hypothetical protein